MKKQSLGTVVVITDRDGHARIDRVMAKAAGAQEVFSFSSGAEARSFMSKNDVNMIICDWTLSDMKGADFVRELREFPDFQCVPVLMASQRNEQADVLEAISSGCSGYIVRPYSELAFEQQIIKAKKACELPGAVSVMLAKAKAMRQQGDMEEAEEEIAQTVIWHPARHYFDRGNSLLIGGDYDQAIEAFQNALTVNKAFAEAYEGLAQAWLGKGEKQEYLKYLKMAARLYAEQDRFREVRNLFIEIIKEDNNASNPFFELGKQLWKKRDHKEAILAWRRALKITPNSEHIICYLAKGYIYLNQSSKAVELLQGVLDAHPNMQEASEIFAYLKGRQQTRQQAGVLSWFRRIIGNITTRLPLRNAA